MNRSTFAKKEENSVLPFDLFESSSPISSANSLFKSFMISYLLSPRILVCSTGFIYSKSRKAHQTQNRSTMKQHGGKDRIIHFQRTEHLLKTSTNEKQTVTCRVTWTRAVCRLHCGACSHLHSSFSLHNFKFQVTGAKTKRENVIDQGIFF